MRSSRPGSEVLSKQFKYSPPKCRSYVLPGRDVPALPNSALHRLCHRLCQGSTWGLGLKMGEENKKTKVPQGVKHFPSLQRCQPDSLCSKSSAFTARVPLITSSLILPLMTQPGSEGPHHLRCSSRIIDTCTVSLSLPCFSCPVTHDSQPV